MIGKTMTQTVSDDDNAAVNAAYNHLNNTPKLCAGPACRSSVVARQPACRGGTQRPY
jgi:hypothetical protein